MANCFFSSVVLLVIKGGKGGENNKHSRSGTAKTKTGEVEGKVEAVAEKVQERTECTC